MADSDPTVPGVPTPRAKSDSGHGSAGSGRFEEIREIARGGMGRVVEAFDRELGRTVALKQSLADNPEIRARFDREIAITARLEHPSIVPLYDAGVSPTGEPFYVMRRVSGAPLDTLIRRANSLDERLLLLPNMLAVADAIAHAHHRDVIHRDLKPSNVIVGELGETMVIDWGLAKLVGEADATVGSRSGGTLETNLGMVIGTPGFMAPEQVRGEPTDARSDVYALGATMFHVLAARPPYVGNEDRLHEQTLAGAVPPLPDGVPADLVTIVHTAMALDPAKRYLDAGGFGEDLRRFLGGQLVASHRYRVHQRMLRWIKKHRTLVIGLAIATSLAVAVAIVSLQRVFTARAQTEQALHAERDRTDDLVVAEATAYLESDPTRALAMLANLRRDSPRWATLGPFVAEARARGVVSSIPESSRVRTIEFARDGSARFLTGGDALRLHDVAHHSSKTLVDAGGGIVAGVWVGAQVLAIGNRTKATLIDPATGARTPLAWPVALHHMASSATTIAFTDSQNRVVVRELDGTLHALDGIDAATSVELNAGGTWLVASNSKTKSAQLIHHTAGAWGPVARLETPWSLFAFDGDAHLAYVASDAAIVEIDLATQAESRRWEPKDTPLLMQYAGGELYATTRGASGVLLLRYRANAPPTPIGNLSSPQGVAELGGQLAILAAPREIVLTAMRTELHAPLDVLSIGADPRGRWLVGATATRLLIWDLTHVVPEALELEADSIGVIDGTTLLVARTSNSNIDVEAVTLDPAHFAIAARKHVATARMLQEVVMPSPGVIAIVDRTAHTMRYVQPDLPSATSIVRVGGEIVSGDAAGRIALGDRELARLGAPIDALTANAGYLAAVAGRTLWLRDPQGATRTVVVERRIDHVAILSDGTIVAASDRELSRFASTKLEHLATLAVQVRALAPLAGRRLAIETADGALHLLEAGATTPHTVFGSTNEVNSAGFVYSADRTVAAVTSNDGVAIIDLRTGEHVQIARGATFKSIALSPDGRALFALGSRLYRFSLALDAPTPATLQGLTNATPPNAPRGALGWRDP